MAKQILTNFDFNNVSKIVNLPVPTDPADAATKQYVDSAVEGLSWKDEVIVASVSNIDISSPGVTIDGVTLGTNDRVLLKDQTVLSQNGIYVFNGSSTPMTRSADADDGEKLEQAIISVKRGTQQDVTFRQTETSITIDTSDVIFSSFGTAAPTSSESTAGIAEVATQVEVDAGIDDSRFVTPLKLASTTIAIGRYQTDIGDGSNTSYAVTHNLGTRDVNVTVYRNSGNYDEVIAEVQHTDINTITILFGSAPASNAYRVVVKK